MKARVIRSEDLVRAPWKNGGGTTAEVAAFPEGSGFDSFGWRISMADVASDGPFSLFPGIDRTLIVVEGGGIELDVEGIAYPLDTANPKLSFSGDDITAGRLLSGPIRDLNVMTRRGQFRHWTRFVESGVALLAEETRAAFIVPFDGSFDVTLGSAIHSLQVLDTLMLEASQDLILLSGTGRAILVEIAPDQPESLAHESPTSS
ncbi:HutD family protein [Microvirga sp. BT689]|uniref:HutD/Ves family protein n=1 Tax=Microvirga arvi TaxID=2778731 RepID=UPI00194FA9CA|nr:HutD family protein [Microvirga arvi]MBM6581028.1 HutD family protein [Microvirga arvi]